MNTLMKSLLALLFVGVAAQAAPSGARAAEVWLSGVDQLGRQAKSPGMGSDYMQLFQPSAPWDRAAAKVQVFELSPKLMTQGSDAELSQIFADLARRHIALAIGGSWLPGGPDGCGRGVEGFSHTGTAQSVAQRVRRLGGDVKYVALDEPLYYGHQYAKPNACQWSIPDVARQLAVGVAAFQQAFPNAQICDVEPVAGPDPGWVDTIASWIKAYQAASGRPLDCFQADVQWKGPWKSQVSALKRRLHAAGVRLGVIYNGDGDAPSGVAWSQQALQRARQVEADPATAPDQALIQSWTRQPEHMLPETEPGTMTWLVNQYAPR